jgi:branched-chain amino acid transport system substrate-binding protein
MRRHILAAAGALALSAILPFTASAQAVRGVTDTEIVIGTYTDLSGVTVAWGVNNSNAIRMAFEEINAKGGIHGRKIRYILEDNQYQVPRSIQAANKLINRDNVFLLIANGGTPMNNAVMPDQLSKGVPNMFPLTSARSMYEPYHRLKFGLASSYYDQMRSAVKLLAERGRKKICAMYQDTDFGRDVMDGARDQLKAMNMSLAAETAHKPTDADFSASVAKLKDAGCDAILLGTIVRDTNQIVAAVRKTGWDVPIMAQVAAYDSAVAEVPGGVTEGIECMTSVLFVGKDDPRPAGLPEELPRQVRPRTQLRRPDRLFRRPGADPGPAERRPQSHAGQLHRRHGEHQELRRHLRLAVDELRPQHPPGLQQELRGGGEERQVGAVAQGADRLLIPGPSGTGRPRGNAGSFCFMTITCHLHNASSSGIIISISIIIIHTHSDDSTPSSCRHFISILKQHGATPRLRSLPRHRDTHATMRASPP